MRWRRLARITKKRLIVAISERERRIGGERFVLVRHRDRKVWAGPYRWQGQTFTLSERFWYQFNTVESAQAAIDGHGFVGVEIQQIA